MPSLSATTAAPALNYIICLAQRSRGVIFRVVSVDEIDHFKEEEGGRVTIGDEKRFVIRKGSKGWMVWDRSKKGPARVGREGVPATESTEREAMRVKEILEEDERTR